MLRPILATFAATFVLTLATALTGCGGGGESHNTSCDTTFFHDADGDGYGDPGYTATGCEAPEGFIDVAGDCNDGDADVHPDAAEVCNGKDDNCNGLIDTADPAIDLTTQRTYYRDADGDGFGDHTIAMSSCDQPTGFVVDDTDCNDAAAAAHPGAAEICDDLDDDCNGLVDDDDPNVVLTGVDAVYADADGDHYGTGSAIIACHPPGQVAAVAGDCNDAAAAVHPGAVEICDGLDNDCDNGVDGTAAQPNQCNAFVGTYTGTYSLSAVEQVGNIVLHTMSCANGASTVTVSLGAAHVIHGTALCHYSGSLGGFDSTQTAVFDATLAVDGSFAGTLTHSYSSSSFDVGDRNYAITGLIAGGNVIITGMGGLYPNAMSTVAWDVNYDVDAN